MRAPIIISSAGVYNTFQRLLPSPLAHKSYFTKVTKELLPAPAAMNIFLGLNASQEELKIEHRYNTWAFPSTDAALTPENYLNMTVEEAMTTDAPLIFFAFPSAKDPNWKKHPGRESKTTCTIVGFASWAWFNKFKNTTLKKRGDEYEEIKDAIGHCMIEQVCKLVPQIKHHIDFVDIGSPLSNVHYLAQPHGEIYGLDHTLERMDPWKTAQLRPETDVPGLYLTGQDILMGGFSGGIFSGVLGAGAVLGRNVMGELVGLHKTLKKSGQ